MEYKGYKTTTVKGSLRYMKKGEKGFKNPNDVPQEVKDYFESLIPATEGSDEPQTASPELEATDNEIEEAYKQMEEYRREEPQEPPQPFTPMELELLDEVERLREKVEDMETSKQPVTSIEDLAKQLHEYYGVYTVWAGKEPQEGDTHPFTAKPMSRYDTGIAYRARNYAEASGTINNDVRAQFEETQRGRAASDEHQAEMEARAENPNFKAPEYKSFDERTSVKGQNAQSSTTMRTRANDPISEEPTQEPNLHGQTIRPYW